jgi:hypothetical protein
MRGQLVIVLLVTAVAGCTPAPDGTGDAGAVQTLTFTVDSSETERGTGDTGSEGLSTGDTYVSNGVLRDEAGDVAGTYHVACTITDENDEQGSAWSLCSTSAVIDGRGALLASAITELLEVQTAGNGFGVAPPIAEFAVVGGTGDFAGAAGQVTSTREPSIRRLEYAFTLELP